MNDELAYYFLHGIHLINIRQYYRDYFDLLALPEYEESVGSLLAPVFDSATQTLNQHFDSFTVGVGFNLERFGVETPPHNFKFDVQTDDDNNLTITYLGNIFND